MINNTPIVDSIHLAGMGENKSNVFKTVLISQEQKRRWINAGGAPDKATIIPVPVEVPNYGDESYREEFGWKDKFVFGMHQRNDVHIFSSIPLEAYDEIENNDTAFLLLGGSDNYKKQAKDLGLKNFKCLPTTGELEPIHKFLNTLDVYAHGRADGEQCSCAIIEAMSHGLPMISHVAPSMGQAEQIADAGKVVSDYSEYAEVMAQMYNDEEYYNQCSKNSKERYNNVYCLDKVISQYIEIYEGIVND